MSVHYGPAAPVNRVYGAWAQRIQLLEPMAELLSRMMRLPRNLTLRAQECDGLAFWSPQAGAVVLCYDYFRFVAGRAPLEELRTILVFSLLHEVGHALVSELNLALPGREEDAVDRFAATVLLDNIRDPAVLLPVARFFRGLEQEGAQSLWDEHLTGGQRYGDLVCLTWGANPAGAGAEGALLPENRRRRCDDEFVQARRAWDQLLEPWSRVRDGSTLWSR